jgi:phage shock protein A
MGIFERTRHIIRSDINTLLSKTKNPEALLDGYLDDLESILSEAKSLRSAEESQRIFIQSRIRDLKAAQQNWEGKARVCLKKGEDDLARSALVHKLDLKEEMEEAARQLSQQETSLDALDETLEHLQRRMDEVHRKRRELKLRRQILEARSELQQAIHTLGPEENAEAFESAQDKMDVLESQIEASESMRQEDSEEKALHLEAADRRRRREHQIQEELESLRAQTQAKKKKA